MSNQEENKNAEWMRAAVAGETATLISLLPSLNLIDLDALELDQGVLKSSGKEDTKAIADYAIKKKTKEQHTQFWSFLYIKSNQEENKNAEWMHAAVAGETATLISLLPSLNLIDLDALELAQGVLKSSGKEDTKSIADYAIKKKTKEQKENKSREWIGAAMAKDSWTLTKLLSSLSIIDLETLELASTLAKQVGDKTTIAITDFAFNKRNKEQDKQVLSGYSTGAISPLRALQYQDGAEVTVEQGSATAVGTLPPPKRVVLTLKRSGEIRDVEINSTNTKQLTNAVKDMSGKDSAYALHEINGETYASLINLKDFKVEVITVQKYIPSDEYITFPMSKLQELLSKDNLEVFLDLYGSGRIYIRVDGHSTQGQQFLGLCMGIFGSTYKGVNSNNIINKGMPGERIGFPGYKSIIDDSQKNDGIVSGLEESRMQIIRGGTVAKITPTGGDFVIFTHGNPESKTSVYIGEVVHGLLTLQNYITNYNPASIQITNVGIHIGTR